MHIVVLGGGYAGLLAAQLLGRNTKEKVTLVNATDRFVERVRLHQLSVGQQLRDRSISGLLNGSGVELVVDWVRTIDAESRTIRLATADAPMPYDHLVYALGSRADLDSTPGAAEHAYSVADLAGAQRLRERLGHGGTVAIVGGGLTGVETAAELAESHPDLKVRMVTGGELGAGLSDRARRHLRETFARLGVEVSDRVRVREVRSDGVVLADAEHVAADIVIWTTGFRAPALAREAGFAVDHNDRIVVDETLRSVSHPEVYAVGDAAASHRPDGQELRMACATALPSAARAALALTDRLAGRTPKPMRFRYFGQCISLGRRDGLVQFVNADDSPKDAVLTGRIAALFKETIARSTIMAERNPKLATFVA